MKKSILEELYYGNVSSCTDCHNTDDETTVLMSYLAAHNKPHKNYKRQSTYLLQSIFPYKA